MKRCIFKLKQRLTDIASIDSEHNEAKKSQDYTVLRKPAGSSLRAVVGILYNNRKNTLGNLDLVYGAADKKGSLDS